MTGDFDCRESPWLACARLVKLALRPVSFTRSVPST